MGIKLTIEPGLAGETELQLYEVLESRYGGKESRQRLGINRAVPGNSVSLPTGKTKQLIIAERFVDEEQPFLAGRVVVSEFVLKGNKRGGLLVWEREDELELAYPIKPGEKQNLATILGVLENDPAFKITARVWFEAV